MEGKAEGEVHLSDVQVAGECTNVPTLNTPICDAILVHVRRAWNLRERLSISYARLLPLLLLLRLP